VNFADGWTLCDNATLSSSSSLLLHCRGDDGDKQNDAGGGAAAADDDVVNLVFGMTPVASQALPADLQVYIAWLVGWLVD